jgi:hypothetical protein
MNQKQREGAAGLSAIVPVVFLMVLFITLPNVSLMRYSEASGVDNPTVVNSTGYTLDWQAIFGQAGVVGVLVWYLYYTTSIAFPKVRQDFRDELASERNHHEGLMSEQRDQVTKLCDSLTRLSDELRTRPCIYRVHEKEG